MTQTNQNETIDFRSIEADNHIAATDVYTGHAHDASPRKTPPTGDMTGYVDGMPYAVHQRYSHRNTTKAVLYDPKSELYAVASRQTHDGGSDWHVKSVGATLRAEHTDHTDSFERAAIDMAGNNTPDDEAIGARIHWWETEASQRLVSDDSPAYVDESMDATEYQAAHESGSIWIKIIAED